MPMHHFSFMAGMDLARVQLEVAMLLTQAACFGIFLWILSRYAVGPVKSVLEERRQKIQAEFDRIAELEKQYQDLKAEYDARLRNIEQEAHQAMQAAINDGRRIAAEVTEQARAEAREIIERAKRTVAIEVDKARIELKDQIIAMTMEATEKILRARLDESRDKQLIAEFVSELERRGAQSNGGSARP